MTYSEYKLKFQAELSALYSLSETSILFDIFMKHLKDWNSVDFRQKINDFVDEQTLEKLKGMLNDLKTGKPYQQILGETEFFGHLFYVNEHVLIPRPETEELLEMAIEKIKNSGLTEDLKILDIGTGSGIIPIIMKKHFPKAKFFAIDYSEKALEVADRNAKLHQVEINFLYQDYLTSDLTAHYDVIISNPPYIGRDEEIEIADSVKEFEPTLALFSPTSNALIFYEKIAADCEAHLAENGLVFLEINQKLGKETLHLFADVLSEAHLLNDLSGNERFIWGRK